MVKVLVDITYSLCYFGTGMHSCSVLLKYTPSQPAHTFIQNLCHCAVWGRGKGSLLDCKAPSMPTFIYLMDSW